MLYTAMGAAKETELRQSVNAHNIANANTDGFKRQVVASRALHATGPGLNTRAYNMTHSAGINSGEGPIKTTQSPSDMTVRGDNWFVLEDSDGEYLSKNLSLVINANGELVNYEGSRIKSSQGVILVPVGSEITVSANGDIYVNQPEQTEIIRLGELKVVTANNNALSLNSKGQVTSEATEDVIFPDVLVGALQQSNVNSVVTAMESMALGNQFNMNMRIFDTAKKVSASTNRILGN